MKGPVLVHVLTKKGKGFRPAEEDKIGTWHGTGPYKMETGAFVKSSTLIILSTYIVTTTPKRPFRPTQ